MYDGQVDLYGLGWILSQLYSNLMPRRGTTLSEQVMRTECGANEVARRELQDIVETRALLFDVNPATRLTLDGLEARAWMMTNREAMTDIQPVPLQRHDTTSQRQFLRRFGKRLVAVSAVLKPPFPAEGMVLKEILSGDWTCLLIEKPNGSYDTFPSADTKLMLRQRIFFGCKQQATVQVTCTSQEALSALVAAMDEEGRVTSTIKVGDTDILQGFELKDPAETKLDVGVALSFEYEPRLMLSHKLKLDFSDSLARSEAYTALSPFSLEFDAFEFPEKLVTPSAVLGPDDFKVEANQLALDFRSTYNINLAGLARPTAGRMEVEWMPGPRSLVCPGTYGLVVRKPTTAGTTLPTITDAELIEKGLAA
jgi:hypothetical protein